MFSNTIGNPIQRNSAAASEIRAKTNEVMVQQCSDRRHRTTVDIECSLYPYFHCTGALLYDQRLPNMPPRKPPVS